MGNPLIDIRLSYWQESVINTTSAPANNYEDTLTEEKFRQDIRIMLELRSVQPRSQGVFDFKVFSEKETCFFAEFVFACTNTVVQFYFFPKVLV